MAIPIKRILVGIDLGSQSSRVMRYALELGSKFDAEIHFLHVMPVVDHAVLNMVAISMGPDKLADLNARNEKELAEKTKKQLNGILKDEAQRSDVKFSVPPQITVHHGDAAPMILDVADQIDVDMIILGSHSKGKLHYAFLGSVAEKVLRKTHRTVLILPPSDAN